MLTPKYRFKFPKVKWKIHKVPTRKGPKIKLPSFKSLTFHPPLTTHHLYGIANKHIPVTSNEAKRETGKYCLNDLFGRKTIEIQGNIS